MILFAADSSSDASKANLEYVDEMMVEGFYSAVSTSLEVLLSIWRGQ